MTLKRVVITGLGALTPLGNDVNSYWNSLKNGVSFSGGNWSVLFGVPRGDVLSGSQSAIGLTKNGSSFSVCVPSSGSITEKASCP